MKRLLLIAALLSTPAVAKDSDHCVHAYKLAKLAVEARMNGEDEVALYKAAADKGDIIAKIVVHKVWLAEPDELPHLAQSIFVTCLKAMGEDV